MKPIILLLLVPLAMAPIHGQTSLPPVVIAGNEPVRSKEFAVWVEEDATNYSGSYSGEPGGDTSATFTIKVSNHDDRTIPFIASGEYSCKANGSMAQTVTFKNAHYHYDSKGVFKAGPFDVTFVFYGKLQGAIIGNCFFKKDR